MTTKTNIWVDQGATFSKTFSVANTTSGDVIDITNYTITSKIKSWYNSSNSVSFVVTVPDPTNGEFVLSLTANTTGNLVAGRYVYDVKTYDSDANTYGRFVEGVLTVNPGVS